MERTRLPDTPACSAVVVSREQIRKRLDELAGDIAAAFGPEELTVVAVLHGALSFAADLRRRLPMPTRVLTVGAASYRGRSRAPGPVRLSRRLGSALAGRRVLIVDDILDTGATLAAVQREVASGGPAEVRSCVLLRKDRGRAAAPRAAADFVGFDIPDVFVVGYGLDLDGRWRDLPDIMALEDPAP